MYTVKDFAQRSQTIIIVTRASTSRKKNKSKLTQITRLDRNTNEDVQNLWHLGYCYLHAAPK